MSRKFWHAVNLNKNKTSNVLPPCLTVGDCVMSEQKKICFAFNKHFAEAGFLFDRNNIMPSMVVDSSCLPTVAPTSHFTFIPIPFLLMRSLMLYIPSTPNALPVRITWSPFLLDWLPLLFLSI